MFEYAACSRQKVTNADVLSRRSWITGITERSLRQSWSRAYWSNSPCSRHTAIIVRGCERKADRETDRLRGRQRETERERDVVLFAEREMMCHLSRMTVSQSIHVLCLFVVSFECCNAIVYSNQWAVKVSGGEDEARRLANQHGFMFVTTVGNLRWNLSICVNLIFLFISKIYIFLTSYFCLSFFLKHVNLSFAPVYPPPPTFVYTPPPNFKFLKIALVTSSFN